MVKIVLPANGDSEDCEVGKEEVIWEWALSSQLFLCFLLKCYLALSFVQRIDPSRTAGVEKLQMTSLKTLAALVCKMQSWGGDVRLLLEVQCLLTSRGRGKSSPFLEWNPASWECGSSSSSLIPGWFWNHCFPGTVRQWLQVCSMVCKPVPKALPRVCLSAPLQFCHSP